MLSKIVYCLLEKLDDGSQNSKQVKESVTVKLPPKKKIIETKDAPKAGEKCKY